MVLFDLALDILVELMDLKRGFSCLDFVAFFRLSFFEGDFVSLPTFGTLGIESFFTFVLSVDNLVTGFSLEDIEALLLPEISLDSLCFEVELSTFSMPKETVVLPVSLSSISSITKSKLIICLSSSLSLTSSFENVS